MFNRTATTADLEKYSRLGDVLSAVRRWDTGSPHKAGDRWAFWMEGDPRSDSGILPLCKYRCVQAGGIDAEWVKD
jgi:hypothetical protein